jgi:hypothetical protein
MAGRTPRQEKFLRRDRELSAPNGVNRQVSPQERAAAGSWNPLISGLSEIDSIEESRLRRGLAEDQQRRLAAYLAGAQVDIGQRGRGMAYDAALPARRMAVGAQDAVSSADSEVQRRLAGIVRAHQLSRTRGR